jgi:hypothetical protein
MAAELELTPRAFHTPQVVAGLRIAAPDGDLEADVRDLLTVPAREGADRA